MSARTSLHRARTLTGSDAVFLTEDAIELDQSVNYEMLRRRVFFDDVQLVTLHRERGIAFLIATGAWGLLWSSIAIFILALDFDAWPAAAVFGVLGLPVLIAFLVRLALGREVVTVFGRRTKAVLRFGALRKQRARVVYGQLCAAIRRGQSAATREESPAPPLPADVPLPPPEQ